MIINKYCTVQPVLSGHTVNSENKPRGLYFSNALFEGFIFGGAYIRRGLSTEGNLRFKIDWASLKVGTKFTVFALFYFVFASNFPITILRGGLYLERPFNGGIFAIGLRGLNLEGLISEFYGILKRLPSIKWSLTVPEIVSFNTISVKLTFLKWPSLLKGHFDHKSTFHVHYSV